MPIGPVGQYVKLEGNVHLHLKVTGSPSVCTIGSR